MKINQRKEPCSRCGIEVPSYDGVNLVSGNTSQFLCSNCYNQNISKTFGFDFEQVSFHPITIEDYDGAPHTFHFQNRLLGDRVYLQALEIKEGEPEGYRFSKDGYVEDDLFGLFKKLVERIRRELARRHIEPDHLTRYSITDDNVVRGHINWDDETEGQVPLLVIDGKELSWYELGRMLMAYEGFHFKLEIFDETEER